MRNSYESRNKAQMTAYSSSRTSSSSRISSSSTRSSRWCCAARRRDERQKVRNGWMLLYEKNTHIIHTHTYTHTHAHGADEHEHTRTHITRSACCVGGYLSYSRFIKTVQSVHSPYSSHIHMVESYGWMNVVVVVFSFSFSISAAINNKIAAINGYYEYCTACRQESMRCAGWYI